MSDVSNQVEKLEVVGRSPKRLLAATIVTYELMVSFIRLLKLSYVTSWK